MLRGVDAIAYCHDVTAPIGPLEQVRHEVVEAGIAKPSVLAATKADEADDGALVRLRAAVPDLPVVPVSVLDDASLDAFREAVWQLTGLVRVFTRRPGSATGDPRAEGRRGRRRCRGAARRAGGYRAGSARLGYLCPFPRPARGTRSSRGGRDAIELIT